MTSRFEQVYRVRVCTSGIIMETVGESELRRLQPEEQLLGKVY